MKKLIKLSIAVFCVIAVFSCTKNKKTNVDTTIPPTSTNITPTPDPVIYTCDDLKAINKIIFITFAYDQKYDLDNDGKITVQDKLVIENNLLKNKATCVTALRTCDDLQAVKDQVQTWSEVQAWASLAYVETLKLALANTIIFNESGQKCTNDFNTGSFIGDVNKNGYLDCSEPLSIKQYVVGQTVTPFEPLLSDIDANGRVSATDALLDQLMLVALFNNYMDSLGNCPQ